jgi:hypothetical protein
VAAEAKGAEREMNSYFPGMLKSDRSMSRYMWCSNGQGEVVVWSLDEEENKTGFAIANGADMVRAMMEYAGEYSAIKAVEPFIFFKGWSRHHYNKPDWDDALKVLNSPKANTTQKYARMVYRILDELGVKLPIIYRYEPGHDFHYCRRQGSD